MALPIFPGGEGCQVHKKGDTLSQSCHVSAMAYVKVEIFSRRLVEIILLEFV